ncbi:hypothetical protein [Ferrimonas marina]|uniref:Phage shock protein B n=1 Tax=Ferrimonas marina TaxID=299255 RepID=A0A1M5X1G1_9GAMM|nr:hypothetical protein [Ferrimonas marina]SHH93378.1 hypothetical protein SAMN02745129_3132 [Ferrimonas marina]
MSFWTFLAIFFGGAFALDAWTSHNKTKQKQADASASASAVKDVAQEVEALKQDNQALRQRVETLEAIVTDRGFDVADEIRKLG